MMSEGCNYEDYKKNNGRISGIVSRSLSFLIVIVMLLLSIAPSTILLNDTEASHIKSTFSSNNFTSSFSNLTTNNSTISPSIQPEVESNNSMNNSIQAAPLVVNSAWTLVFYFSDSGGSSSITQYIQDDLNALSLAGSDGSVRILAMINWNSVNDKAYEMTTDYQNHEIALSSINPAWTNGEIVSGEPSTLAYWGRYCVDYYTANQYAIILAGHADGIYGGIPDDTTPNKLNPRELGSALSSIKTEIIAKGGSNIGLVGFDCCREGLIEIADEIHSFADAMVASEMDTWWYPLGSHWGWTNVINYLKLNYETPYDLGANFINNYVTWCQGQSLSCTLSVIDLGTMNTLMQSYLKPLTENITIKWTLSLKTQIATAASLTQKYHIVNTVKTELDLRDFAYYLSQYVSDSTIQNIANNLHTYLSIIGSGHPVRTNGHFTGNNTQHMPMSNLPTGRACGLAINFFYASGNTYDNVSGAPVWYKGCRLLDQTNIQNDTCLDKMMCAYNGLSTLPLQDNFTVNSIDDWQNHVSGANLIQFNLHKGNFKIPCMEIFQSSDNVVVFTRHYFNQRGAVVAQANLMTSTTATNSVFIVMDDPGHYCAYTGFVNGQFAYHYNGNWVPVTSMSVNVWYQITLYIRPDTSTFDIYINGLCIQTNAPFDTAATGGYVDVVYFQTGNGNGVTSNLWVDDVSVMAGNRLLQDPFVTLPQQANGWSTITTGGKLALTSGTWYSTSPSAKLSKISTTGVVAMGHSITPQTTHVIGQAAMVVNTISNCYAYFIMRTGGTSYNSVYFVMSAGTFVWCENGQWISTGVTYSVNKWYLITLDVHVNTRTFDIYIDGSLIVANANWYNQGQASQIDAVYF